MKPRNAFLFLIVTSLLLSASANGADEQLVKTPLEGKWKVISASSNGGDYMQNAVGKMIVTVEKDEIRFTIDGTDAEQAAKFVLRPDKQPAEIDFKQTKDRGWNNDNPVTKLFRGYQLEEGKAIPADEKGEGIYKIEGDHLTLCWRTIKGREIGKDGKISKESVLRPTVFQSHLYYHQILFVLKRVP